MLLNNFRNYFLDLMRSTIHKSVRSLKITLSGFDLTISNNLLRNITDEIARLQGKNISILWLRTCNLSGVTLLDFEAFLRLSERLSDINF